MGAQRGWNPHLKATVAAAGYAARQTILAVGDTFKEARAIMGWLADMASIVAKQRHEVVWKSPLGLTIRQPYMQARSVKSERARPRCM